MKEETIVSTDAYRAVQVSKPGKFELVERIDLIYSN
jgi:hypothetical protein